MRNRKLSIVMAAFSLLFLLIIFPSSHPARTSHLTPLQHDHQAGTKSGHEKLAILNQNVRLQLGSSEWERDTDDPPSFEQIINWNIRFLELFLRGIAFISPVFYLGELLKSHLFIHQQDLSFRNLQFRFCHSVHIKN